MGNRRFQVIAGLLTAAVLTAAWFLAPTVHGQARMTPVALAETFALHAAEAAAEAAAQQDPQVQRFERVFEVMGPRGSEIGVAIAELPEADVKAGRSGVKVQEVREGSPAASAGVKAGDIVTSFDGERVRGARQFARLVQETPAGQPVKVQVQRDGKATELTVTPEAPRSARGPMPSWPGEEGGDTRFRMERMPRVRELLPFGPGDFDFEVMAAPGRLGIGVQELTPELAEFFGVEDGVLVTSVGKDSPGARAGLKAGDVITTVDGATVEDATDLRRRLRQDDARDATLGIVREKKSMSLKVTFDEPSKAETANKKRRV